jgi:hypothetical protein
MRVCVLFLIDVAKKPPIFADVINKHMTHMTTEISLHSFTIEQLETFMDQLWEAIENESDTLQKIRINQLRTKCLRLFYTMKENQF